MKKLIHFLFATFTVAPLFAATAVTTTGGNVTTDLNVGPGRSLTVNGGTINVAGGTVIGLNPAIGGNVVTGGGLVTFAGTGNNTTITLPSSGSTLLAASDIGATVQGNSSNLTIFSTSVPLLQIGNGTWAGNSSITMFGTVTTGTFSGTAANLTFSGNQTGSLRLGTATATGNLFVYNGTVDFGNIASVLRIRTGSGTATDLTWEFSTGNHTGVGSPSTNYFSVYSNGVRVTDTTSTGLYVNQSLNALSSFIVTGAAYFNGAFNPGTGTNSMRLGLGSLAGGTNTTAIGIGANASIGIYSMSWGDNSSAGRVDTAMAVGAFSRADEIGLALGPYSNVTGRGSTGLGWRTFVDTLHGLANGYGMEVRNSVWGANIHVILIGNDDSDKSGGTIMMIENGWAMHFNQSWGAHAAVDLTPAGTAQKFQIGRDGKDWLDTPTHTSESGSNGTLNLGGTSTGTADGGRGAISISLKGSSDNNVLNSRVNAVTFYGNSTTTITTSVNGTFNVTGDINYTGDITDISDARYKTNVRPLAREYGLGDLMKLRPVTFDWNDEYARKFHKSATTPQIGFIAQEVNQVMPEVVNTLPGGDMGIDYSKLSAVLTAAVQRMNTRDEWLFAALFALTLWSIFLSLRHARNTGHLKIRRRRE